MFLYRLLDDYNESMKGVMNRLVRKSSPNQLTYIGELLQGSEFSPKMVRINPIDIHTRSALYSGLPYEKMAALNRIIKCLIRKDICLIILPVCRRRDVIFRNFERFLNLIS